MRRLAALSQRTRGRLALLAWLAGMLLGGALIARTAFSTDLSAFLPASPDARQRVLIEQLQNGVAARTLLIGIDGGDAVQRARASRTLAAALRGSTLFEQVQNGDRGDEQGAESGDWQAAGRWLVEHRYQLSPAVTPERFTVAGLRDAIDETLSLLGTPAGNAVKPLLERDPTGEMQRIAESLIPASAPRSEEGVWVARTAARALLLLTTRAAGADLDAQAAALERVRGAFAPLAAQGLQLQLSGPPLFAVQSRARIEHEARQLAIVGSLVMGGLLLLAFASLRALAVALLPVATGIVAGIAVVGLGFGNVHGLTLAFGSTLIGEAVDYAIYYLIQARGAAVPGTGWQRWRHDNWPTVRLGLLTSVCGFAALAFSGFPGLAQLGVFSMAGLAGAALATRFVLPVLVPDGAAGQGLRQSMGRWAAAALRLLPRLRIAIFLLGALALGVLLTRSEPLWRGSLGSLSPVPQEALALDEQLRADLGASDARTLVVATGADPQAALRAAEAAGLRLDALVEQGLLAGYETPTRLLPSVATQRARLASLPEAALLRERLQEATAGGPLKAMRLEAFIAEVQVARGSSPIERAALAGTPLASVVDALMLQRRGGGWSALIALQPGPTELEPQRLRGALQGLAGIDVVDIGLELGSLYDSYLHEAFLQALLGALAVVVLLAFYLRSAQRLFTVCLPLALAMLFTLAGLAVFDVALGILHLVGLLLVVAVGSNYALFFDQLRNDGVTGGGRTAAPAPLSDDTLASLLLANLTTVASFGLIALSDIPALSAIGRVVAPGALLALLLAAACSRPLRVARRG
ncbi:MMPL family transporter [Methylibium sp.]|uniref:MMPL family transporter n=1 Tax=Methylibium sp. TaxID=2067992 RepID=UPI003D0FE56E